MRIATWQVRMTAFLESRSASAPPSGPRIICEMPCAKTTKPTARLLSVNSKATTACTTVDMKNATKARRVPIQSTRKLRLVSAAKVLVAQEVIRSSLQVRAA